MEEYYRDCDEGSILKILLELLLLERATFRYIAAVWSVACRISVMLLYNKEKCIKNTK